MSAPKIIRVHVNVLMVTADGRAIDRSADATVPEGAFPDLIAEGAAGVAASRVLAWIAGLDNRKAVPR